MVGAVMLYVTSGDVSSIMGGLASFMMILPIPLALNITLGRRRRNRKEDSPDSIEFQAARTARAGAYVDTVILGLVLLLVLLVVPGQNPALWCGLFLATAVIAFWARYAVELRSLRG